jgi:putative acetyltransferase
MELPSIRDFRVGDEMALQAVFHSAVHVTAAKSYTQIQIDAWAPREIDVNAWIRRMREIRPFVVETGGRIIAYADVQANGYIDHFYVAGACARQGVGTLLMNHIFAAARRQNMPLLSSDVSRFAQPFFQKFGFIVVEQKSPLVHGVVVPNAHMQKTLG